MNRYHPEGIQLYSLHDCYTLCHNGCTIWKLKLHLSTDHPKPVWA